MSELEEKWVEVKKDLQGDLFCIDAYAQVQQALGISKFVVFVPPNPLLMGPAALQQGIQQTSPGLLMQEDCDCKEDPYNCRRTCGLCAPAGKS